MSSSDQPTLPLLEAVPCLDVECMRECKKNPNLCVPWFLMACYAYGELSMPILTDECFDHLSTFMSQHWNIITHRHKHTINCDGSPEWKGSTIHVRMKHLPNITTDTTKRLVLKLYGNDAFKKRSLYK